MRYAWLLVCCLPAILTPPLLEAQRTWALPDSLSFCGETIPLNDREVRERLEEVFVTRIGQDERLILLLKRTTKYFPAFERVLKETEAPDDLKYLAAAESGLRLDAVSNAGAGGLWQFIPSTARLWGLNVNRHVDERFHVEKSTRAAVTMLKHLREAYGSWSLAAAAYNTGQANMNQVLREQGLADYYDLFLNRETRYYVFQIAVLKEILEHPDRYSLQLSPADLYAPYDDSTQTVTLKGSIADLSAWAAELGCTFKTIKVLNYWIVKNSLPDGTWELMLPSTVQWTNEDSLKSVALVTEARTDSTLRYVFHTVERSDYLEKIARQYDVTVRQIMEWNNLKSPVAMLGTRLKVFVRETRQTFYTVKAGDTLYRIASLFKVSITQIRTWNEMLGDDVRVGQELVLYVETDD